MARKNSSQSDTSSSVDHSARSGAVGGGDRIIREATCKDSAEPNLEMLSKIYAGIQDQIKFADSKAGFVAAFNAILLSFISGTFGIVGGIFKNTHSGGLSVSLAVAVIVAAIPVVVSVAYVLCAVFPRHGADTHKSRIFYGHVATQYKRDAARYSADVLAMSDDEWASDYAHQITEIACIAKSKHDSIRISIRVALGGFLGIVVVSAVVQFVSLVSAPPDPKGGRVAGHDNDPVAKAPGTKQ